MTPLERGDGTTSATVAKQKPNDRTIGLPCALGLGLCVGIPLTLAVATVVAHSMDPATWWLWKHRFTGGGRDWYELSRATIGFVGAFGLWAGLVLAYRRQQTNEQAERHERDKESRRRRKELEDSAARLYDSAVTQLGNASPSVRTAAMYTLARLGDAAPSYRQNVVAIGCAYLRTPDALFRRRQERDDLRRAAPRQAVVEEALNGAREALKGAIGESGNAEAEEALMGAVQELERAAGAWKVSDGRQPYDVFTEVSITVADVWRGVEDAIQAAPVTAPDSAVKAAVTRARELWEEADVARKNEGWAARNEVLEEAFKKAERALRKEEETARRLGRSHNPEDVVAEAESRYAAQRLLSARLHSVLQSGWVDGEFPSSLDLAGAHLHDADFSGMQLPGSVDFQRALFTGTTTFDDAAIEDTADFSHARFTGDSNFNRVKFRGTARFDGTEFYSGLWFMDSECMEVHFSGAEVFRAITLNGTEFSGRAIFQRMMIKGDANFGRIRFHSDAWFMGTTSQQPVFFDGSHFTGELRAPSELTVSTVDCVFDVPARFE